MSRRKVVIGIVALAAAAFASGAYAATQSGGATTTRQAFLDDLAGRLGVSPRRLETAIRGALQDQINAAVRAGRVTQAQARALERRLAHGGGVLAPLLGLRLLGLRLLGPRLLRLRLLGLSPPRPRALMPPGARAAPPARGGPVPLFGGLGALRAAAAYLGLSRAELRAQLSAGRSLAQIARARGKQVAGLARAMIATLRSRLRAAVARGRITAATERRMLAAGYALIAALVKAPWARLWPHPPGPPGVAPIPTA